MDNFISGLLYLEGTRTITNLVIFLMKVSINFTFRLTLVFGLFFGGGVIYVFLTPPPLPGVPLVWFLTMVKLEKI